MNVFSTVFFLLGIVSSYLFAIGMDPYSCGIPLCFFGLSVIFSCYRGDLSWGRSWMFLLVVVSSVYFGVRIWQSSVIDFARSDGLLLAGAISGFCWVSSQKKQSWMILLGALWLLLVANVMVAAVQAYSDVTFYPVYGQRATIDFPSGLYLHYNHFANFMLGAGLLSLGVAMAGGCKRTLRVLAGLMYLLAAYGVVLSHSRGAMLGLGCATAFATLGWLANLQRRKVSWAGVAFIVAAVLAPVVIAGAWKLGEKSLAQRNAGDSGRLEFASMAMDLIAEKPLWGGGARSFFFDSVKKWNEKEMYVGTGDIQYVHNEYLQAAVDYGLVGLSLLLFIFCFAMFRGIVSITMLSQDNEEDSGIALGAMAALVGMGIQAFFSFVYHVLPDVVLMAICLGLLSRQAWFTTDQKQTVVLGRRNRSMVAMVLCIGGGTIALSARDAIAWYRMLPLMGAKELDPQAEIRVLRSALQIRPDFRVMGDLSKTIVNQTKGKDLALEERKNFLEAAIAVQRQAVDRAPQSYQDRLNLALMYDSAGRFDEATPLYEAIVDDLDARERYYRTRFHYMRHLVMTAHAVWRKRNPEQALSLFIKAREQSLKIKHGFYQETQQVADEAARCIKFLEEAGITPQSDE